jgi:hypothetical protein
LCKADHGPHADLHLTLACNADDHVHDSAKPIGALQGSLGVGDVFGERALVDQGQAWTESAVAGQDGADVLCIDRALFQHFALAAGAVPGGVPSQVSAALRVACCRQALRTAARDRTDADVDMLVAFLHELPVSHFLHCSMS